MSGALASEPPGKGRTEDAADQAITKIDKKLAKRTYDEPLEKYAYGAMVVGMALWFAVPRMALSEWKMPSTIS